MLPEFIESYRARINLKRAIEKVKLQNRIRDLKRLEEDPENSDIGEDAPSGQPAGYESGGSPPPGSEPASLFSKFKSGKGSAIFREVALAKLAEARQEQEALAVQEEAEKEAKRRSFQA